jgi:hypothetical protein
MLHVLDNFMSTNDFGLLMQGDTCAAYLEMQMTFRAKQGFPGALIFQ